MAFRIHREVAHGEIDNTVRGTIRGRVWLAGQDEPLILDLKGNCHPDIAGCRVEFRNPRPAPCARTNTSLATDQSGEAGDMTASRKVRLTDPSALADSGSDLDVKPTPERWGNCLYLEWYSGRNGRVVIESPDYDVTVSAPEWRLTDDEAANIREQSAAAFAAFLAAVEEALPGPRETPEPPASRPMDEFEWEQFLKHSDRRSARLGELTEKFMDDPARDRKTAEAMGWKWLEEVLDEAGADDVGDVLANQPDQSGDDDGDEPDWPPDSEDLPELTPNPLTRGRFWIEDEGGHVCHPLAKRASALCIAMFHACEAAGLMGENGDEDIDEMVFKTQCMGAKLAGALNHLAYEELPLRDPGFVIACLKRGLDLLKDALNAHQRVVERRLGAEHSEAFGRELFAIREEILALSAELRGMMR